MRVGIGVTQLGQFAEPTITREIAVLIGTAARFGRDTSTLRLVLRSSPTFSEVALGSDRPRSPAQRSRSRTTCGVHATTVFTS
jgi:hypothetical protein